MLAVTMWHNKNNIYCHNVTWTLQTHTFEHYIVNEQNPSIKALCHIILSNTGHNNVSTPYIMIFDYVKGADVNDVTVKM